MNFFLRLILISILSYFLSFIAPWWIIVVVGIIGGLLLPGSSLTVFVSGFLGVGMVWMGYAWMLDSANESHFSSMISEIFPINDPLLLIVFAGLIGGFCGGFSALTGSTLRMTDLKKKSKGYYH